MGSCGYYSSEYLCQRALKSHKCSSGSPSNCKLTNVPVPGYSPGQLARVDNGKRVRRSTESHSCPSGWKIWSPRNKNDWNIVYNALGKNIGRDPRSPHLIVDVTRGGNGCGGCTRYPMKSGVSQQNSWRTRDGSPWWLRDARYNEPNGDYHANCYLHIYDVNPNNVRFNDGNCNYYSTEYLCQKVWKPKYYYAGGNRASCTQVKRKSITSEAACKQAAANLKKPFRGSGSYATWPKYCFWYNNGFYYNKHGSGRANKSGNPVCT